MTDRLFNVPGSWTIDKCTNIKCGLLWLNPMPVTEDLAKLYESYYTHTHITQPKEPNWFIALFREGCSAYLNKEFQYQFDETLVSKVIAKVIRFNPKWTTNLDFSVYYLPAKKNGKLLEIGCGNGAMLKNMERMGWDVEGVDFDPKCISAARKLDLTVYEGDISQLDFNANSFDAIVMNHVIEHLPDPISTLKECHRLLRKRGKLILVTPNTNGINHLKYKSNTFILDLPRHLFIHNIPSLTKLATLSNFDSSICFTTVHGFAGFSWASQKLSSSKGRVDLRAAIPKTKIVFAFNKRTHSRLLFKAQENRR